MKSGQFSRLWGRQFSFTVATLVLTSLFLWSWENNPLLSSLLSAEEQFVMHTPDDSLLLFNSEKELTDEDPHSYSQVAKVKNHAEAAKNYDNSMDNASVLSSERKDDRVFLASSSQKQACNYAKGRWVTDSRRPLYSGFGCKQWLSDMWACRLTQRTDFSYEGYRWQPNNCEMPEFQRTTFLKRMQDKTIAFVGDSLGRQQFQSLMCMATGGEERPEIEDVGWKYGLVIPPGSLRPDGWAYYFPDTNTTILYYWSASLCDIQPINATDPNTEFAMHLDQPPSFLTRFLPQLDVVILNTGHHWNRGKLNANHWVMHAKGKPVTNSRLARMGDAKNLTIYSISRWFDSQIALRPQLKVFFRTISPRHFSDGDWNTGGRCDNLTPLTKGSGVFQDESSDPVIADGVRGTKVKLLDITAISELRDEGHIARYSIKASEGINDCLHWCLPGIPDTWNELLYAQM